MKTIVTLSFKLTTFLFTLILLGLPPASLNASPLPKIKNGQPLPANLFVKLAKLVNPTVVNISTTQVQRRRRRLPNQPRDPFFDLFEQFMLPQMPQARPRQSLGTGFIIRKDGLIITNNHVIERADIIKVQLSENSSETYEAKVIGRDARTDIALIKISSKKDLPVAVLGSSKSLEVGEWVAAFGNPFGHGHTVTKGIISAIGREIDELNRFPFLQTDASINPGNSGGPLVNTQGLVIGVNTAIDARAQGIGFAIPIDNVKSIIKELETSGGIKRGYIGVYLADIDERSAKSLNLKTNKGALITQTLAGGPAEKAGFKPYDLIVKFGKSKVDSSRDLVRAVTDHRVGDRVKVEVIRNGKRKTIKLKIAEHPDDPRTGARKPKTYQGQKAPFNLGFKVSDFTPRLGRDFGLPKLKRSRPVVIEVEPNSIAARSGLVPGDTILDVNRKPVYRAKDVLRRLQKGTTNVLRVLRTNGQAVLVYIPAK